MASHNNARGSKKFVYFALNREDQAQQKEGQDERNLSKDVLDRLLKALGREVLREKTPSLQELEQTLQGVMSSTTEQQQESRQEQKPGSQADSKAESGDDYGMPLVRHLVHKGYLKDSPKWLSAKGFTAVGGKILSDVMKALKAGEYGMHETYDVGSGSLVLDTSKKYEPGDDIRLLNVPKSLLNTILRTSKSGRDLKKLPLHIDVEDFEEYEMMQDVRVAVVYCIDLSSTMRYSSMYGEMSRIEAAKRALWSLYLLNRKFFPSDSVSIVGFGALASKVAPQDIPYLKTFEPGSDFLHYTNYQAALRLASKILQKNGAINKRIVLVTDGHPSACFIDNKSEQEKILSQRPYSHFYTPDRETIDNIKQDHSMNLDVKSGELVYLCYRYRQVDQYIGERTIAAAKKCRSMNIDIDTIMISEEDSLLGYVNEMERDVKGRSYYINPVDIDKVLLTDYLDNKKQKMIRAGTW
jgi:uncharacterized protein with von Willebrand factor type A (vWA) domain